MIKRDDEIWGRREEESDPEREREREREREIGNLELTEREISSTEIGEHNEESKKRARCTLK